MIRCAAALGLVLSVSSSAVAQETAYAVTFNDLVEVNLDDASQSQIIGAHGLPISVRPDGKMFGAFSITCGPDGRLLGLHYELRDDGNFDQYLVEYDKSSGEAAILMLLSSSDAEGYVETIEYVDSLGALVISVTPTLASGTFTAELRTLDPDTGASVYLTNNNRDNDYGVHDSSRDLFYTIDPNAVGRLTQVDLGTGANADLGNTPATMADMAYSCERDEIFAYDVATDELISYGDGSEPEAIWLGVFGLGDVVQGLAICCGDDAADCPGDLDGDGDVDYRDFWYFIWAYWNRDDAADINGDGKINREDKWAFFDAYINGCPGDDDDDGHWCW